MNKLLMMLLEKTPVLKFLNGNKRIVTIIVTALGALAQAFPELPILEHINGAMVMILGLLGFQVAAWHADEKTNSVVKKLTK